MRNVHSVPQRACWETEVCAETCQGCGRTCLSSAFLLLRGSWSLSMQGANTSCHNPLPGHSVLGTILHAKPLRGRGTVGLPKREGKQHLRAGRWHSGPESVGSTGWNCHVVGPPFASGQSAANLCRPLGAAALGPVPVTSVFHCAVQAPELPPRTQGTVRQLAAPL